MGTYEKYPYLEYQCEIIGDFVYYLVPHGILVLDTVTVLLYLRTYSLLVFKPHNRVFLDSLGI
jgi:hypothetical protein